MGYELDEQSLRDISQGLALLSEADELLRRCKACGMDTTPQELMAQALRERLDAVKRNFGTNRRD